VDVLEDGHSFGEFALINNKPRAASIYCLSNCHFAVLNKSDYKRILQKVDEHRIKGIVEILKKQPIFDGFTRLWLIRLSYYFKEKTFWRNQTVYTEGSEANEIYLI
jgi:CRP-like cAMP-binding protein